MMSDSDKQYLLSIASDENFINFMQIARVPISEYERILSEFINASDLLKQYDDNAFLCDWSRLINPVNCLSLNHNKEFTNDSCPTDSSETDVSLNDRQVFKIIKSEKNYYQHLSFRTDCIRKKIKCMFHKYILVKLNKLNPERDTMPFKQLPKILSVTLNLRHNKIWSEMTIRELLTLDNIKQTGNDEFNRLHNIKMLNQVKSDDLTAFLNTTWRSAFEEFLQSSYFSKSINELKKRSSAFSEKFHKHALLFLDYINH